MKYTAIITANTDTDTAVTYQIDLTADSMRDAIRMAAEVAADADFRVRVTPCAGQELAAAFAAARQKIKSYDNWVCNDLSGRLVKASGSLSRALSDPDVSDLVSTAAMAMWEDSNPAADVAAAYDRAFKALDAYLDSQRGVGAASMAAIEKAARADRLAINDAARAAAADPADNDTNPARLAARKTLHKVRASLTPRQWTICRLRAQDKSWREVADALKLKSMKQVYKHKALIEEKAAAIDPDYMRRVNDCAAAVQAADAADAAALAVLETAAAAYRRAALAVDPAAVLPSATCGKRHPVDRRRHAWQVIELSRAAVADAADADRARPAARKAMAAAVLALRDADAAALDRHRAALTAARAADKTDRAALDMAARAADRHLAAAARHAAARDRADAIRAEIASTIRAVSAIRRIDAAAADAGMLAAADVLASYDRAAAAQASYAAALLAVDPDALTVLPSLAVPDMADALAVAAETAAAADRLAAYRAARAADPVVAAAADAAARRAADVTAARAAAAVAADRLAVARAAADAARLLPDMLAAVDRLAARAAAADMAAAAAADDNAMAAAMAAAAAYRRAADRAAVLAAAYADRADAAADVAAADVAYRAAVADVTAADRAAARADYRLTAARVEYDRRAGR